MTFIDRHPWFPFALAFVALLFAWSTMVVIAVKYRPESVPLEQSSVQPDHPADKPLRIEH